MLLKEEEKVVQDKEFLYEIKFDGIRALIYVSKNSFKILSRKGNDLTNKYPELKKKKKIVGDHQVIFDGEIIATNNGLPSFSLLQQRNRIKKVIDEIIEEIPVTFIAFDILYDNKNLMSESLLNRKKILEKYNDTNYFIKSKVYDNGINLFKMIKKVGLEVEIFSLRPTLTIYSGFFLGSPKSVQGIRYLVFEVRRRCHPWMLGF